MQKVPVIVTTNAANLARALSAIDAHFAISSIEVQVRDETEQLNKGNLPLVSGAYLLDPTAEPDSWPTSHDNPTHVVWGAEAMAAAHEHKRSPQFWTLDASATPTMQGNCSKDVQSQAHEHDTDHGYGDCFQQQRTPAANNQQDGMHAVVEPHAAIQDEEPTVQEALCDNRALPDWPDTDDEDHQFHQLDVRGLPPVWASDDPDPVAHAHGRNSRINGHTPHGMEDVAKMHQDMPLEPSELPRPPEHYTSEPQCSDLPDVSLLVAGKDLAANDLPVQHYMQGVGGHCTASGGIETSLETTPSSGSAIDEALGGTEKQSHDVSQQIQLPFEDNACWTHQSSKKQCNWYRKGRCKFAGQCRYAHGPSELEVSELPRPPESCSSRRAIAQQDEDEPLDFRILEILGSDLHQDEKIARLTNLGRQRI